jgi:hypothetical protein
MRNTRPGSLGILNFDSGSYNFSRVILDPCYQEFLFDGCVAGGRVLLKLGCLSIFFLIGGDGSSSLPARPVQPVKIRSGTSFTQMLVTKADAYLLKGTWLEDSESYIHRGYTCLVSPITRLFTCLSFLSN